MLWDLHFSIFSKSNRLCFYIYVLQDLASLFWLHLWGYFQKLKLHLKLIQDKSFRLTLVGIFENWKKLRCFGNVFKKFVSLILPATAPNAPTTILGTFLFGSPPLYISFSVSITKNLMAWLEPCFIIVALNPLYTPPIP